VTVAASAVKVMSVIANADDLNTDEKAQAAQLALSVADNILSASRLPMLVVTTLPTDSGPVSTTVAPAVTIVNPTATVLRQTAAKIDTIVKVVAQALLKDIVSSSSTKSNHLIFHPLH
jgi:hypothetical protein